MSLNNKQNQADDLFPTDESVSPDSFSPLDYVLGKRRPGIHTRINKIIGNTALKQHLVFASSLFNSLAKKEINDYICGLIELWLSAGGRFLECKNSKDCKYFPIEDLKHVANSISTALKNEKARGKCSDSAPMKNIKLCCRDSNFQWKYQEGRLCVLDVVIEGGTGSERLGALVFAHCLKFCLRDRWQDCVPSVAQCQQTGLDCCTRFMQCGGRFLRKIDFEDHFILTDATEIFQWIWAVIEQMLLSLEDPRATVMLPAKRRAPTSLNEATEPPSFEAGPKETKLPPKASNKGVALPDFNSSPVASPRGPCLRDESPSGVTGNEPETSSNVKRASVSVVARLDSASAPNKQPEAQSCQLLHQTVKTDGLAQNHWCGHDLAYFMSYARPEGTKINYSKNQKWQPSHSVKLKKVKNANVASSNAKQTSLADFWNPKGDKSTEKSCDPEGDKLTKKKLADLAIICQLRKNLAAPNDKRPGYKDKIVAPRDTWYEDAVVPYLNVKDADPASMVLNCIIISDSAQDGPTVVCAKLLFDHHLVNSKEIYEFAQKMGMNALCALLSRAGKQYKTAMSIVNAAKYFVVNHGGIIPPDIQASELMKLHNVGHKTTHLVLQVGLKREAEAIPNDIHLLNMFYELTWISYKARNHREGSRMASEEMQQWVPPDQWKEMNGIFAGLGQIMKLNMYKEAVIWEAERLGMMAILKKLFAAEEVSMTLAIPKNKRKGDKRKKNKKRSKRIQK